MIDPDNLAELDELRSRSLADLDELADLQAEAEAYADELAELVPTLRANYAEALADMRKKNREADVT